jgi:hypothetical protein
MQLQIIKIISDWREELTELRSDGEDNDSSPAAKESVAGGSKSTVKKVSQIDRLNHVLCLLFKFSFKFYRKAIVFNANSFCLTW